MSVRRLCVNPVDRKDTLSKLGETCTTATCWWKCDDMACSLRITTELMLFTARRFFLEPHFIPVLERKKQSVNEGEIQSRKHYTISKHYFFLLKNYF